MTVGQLTPTSARALALRYAPRSTRVFARRLGEAAPGSPAWERANLWKTGLFVGGLLVAIGIGVWFFVGAPPPPKYGRPSRVSMSPEARR